MGMTKRHMEQIESEREVAAQLAIDAGLISRCPYHGTLSDSLAGERTDAYKLGNYRISIGQYKDVFRDRRAMTEAVDYVVQNAGMECES